MDNTLKKKIEYLSSGTTKEYLIDFLSYIKDQVADVRTELDVEPSIENAVRKATIKVIDDVIIGQLRPKQKVVIEPELYN